MRSIKKIETKFIEQFKDTPGILHMQEVPREGFLIVFIDKKNLKTCIPSEFEGVHVSFFDVRHVQKTSRHILSVLKKMKIDLSIPKNKKGFEDFQKTFAICNRLLSS